MRRLIWVALVVVAAGGACGSDPPPEEPDAPCATPAEIDGLRLNQIQVVGSHNSYRRRTYAPLFAFIQGLTLPEGLTADSLDYDHLPLPEQLDRYRMRGFELDVFNDPEGGRFYNRQGLRFINEPVESNIPELLDPGLKVLHIPDVDYETNFQMGTDQTLSSVLARYDEVAAETERVIAGVDLEDPVPVPKDVPWFPDDIDAWSVRWVLLHVIEETARHAGHADIIRESIDGATAFPLMAAAEGWPATQWLQPWTPSS